MDSGGAGSTFVRVLDTNSNRRDMKNDNATTRNKVTIAPTARKRESIY